MRVVAGFALLGLEESDDIAWRKGFLRQIGYELGRCRWPGKRRQPRFTQGRLALPPLRVTHREGLHLQDLPGGRYADVPLLGQGRQITVQFRGKGQKVSSLILRHGPDRPKAGCRSAARR